MALSRRTTNEEVMEFSPRRAATLSAIATGGLAALGFALRIHNVANQSIWADEIYTMLYAKMGFLEMLRFHTSTFDPHAPLFYVIMKLWVQVAGTNELAFRYPSIFFGVLLIPTVFVLGKLLGGSVLGLLSVLLVAANPFQVWYAQEARTYTLTALLAALSTFLFIKILTMKTTRRVWVAYVVFTTLGVYSHYFSFFVVAFQNIAFLIIWRQKKLNLRHWSLAQAFLVVPYLPWASFAAQMFWRHYPYLGPKPIWEVLPSFATTYSVGWFLSSSQTAWLPILLGLVTIAPYLAAFFPSRTAVQILGQLTSRQTLLILALGSLVPIGGAYVFFLTTGKYYVQERYLIVTTPAFYLVLAFGLLQLGRVTRVVPIFLIVGVVGIQAISLANLYTSVQFAKPDYRTLAGFIEKNERDGDIIIGMGDVLTAVLNYYYGGNLRIYNITESIPVEDIPQTLQDLVSSHSRVWFLPYWNRPTDLATEDWLNQNTFKIENSWLRAVRYELYSTKLGRPQSTQQVGAIFQNEVALTSYSISSTRLEAGDAIQLRLFWKALENGKRDLKVTVRLKDGNNHVINQIDRRPQDDARITIYWVKGETIIDNYGIMIPYGSPPGKYNLEVGLYDRDTGQPLLAPSIGEPAQKAVVSIEPVEVVKSQQPVKTAALRFEHSAGVEFGSLVHLIGFDRLHASARPGDPLAVPIYWQTLATIASNLEAEVRFVKSGTEPAAEVRDTLGPASYGTSLWSAGEIVRDFLDISVPNRLQSGTYSLLLTVNDGKQELQAAPPTTVILGDVAVKARQHSFEAPNPQQKLYTSFGGIAELLGYDLESTPQGDGQPTKLTLYWRSQKETDTSYAVFAHLLDSGEKIWGQSDSIPAANAAPTTSWVTGEVITDRHVIPVSPGAQAGRYSIEVGLYNATTGVRLRRENGEDRIILQELSLP